MSHLIALVEDDEVIRENYRELLESAGFSVNAYANRNDAMAGMATLPDLVLLDVTLGVERDAGFELCADLRRRSQTLPIIFLTSHDSEFDKISGLRLGADDYLTKDISLDHLVVRIETLFRRLAARDAAGANDVDVLTGLNLDASLSRARWRGEVVDLTLTQYWMLKALVEKKGQVVTHNELMRAAQIVVEPNTIAAHVKAIRDAFRELDAAFDGIKTERGRGYRWVVA